MTPQEKTQATRQRHAAAQKAAETYKRHRAQWKERERERREEQTATAKALRAVRDSADATPEQVLEAVKLLMELDI